MASGQNLGLVSLAEAARLVKAPSCRDLGFALARASMPAAGSANPTSASAC